MKHFLIILLIPLVMFSANPVSAQDGVSGPTYTIQSGDTLYIIAVKFGVSIDEIIAVNSIQDPNLLSAGQTIIIPGLEGVTGNLTAETIPIGASLRSLSVQYQFPIPVLARLNKLTSPGEIFAGSSLILPLAENNILSKRDEIHPGETLLDLSILNQTNPWVVALQNELTQTWQANSTQPIFFSGNPGSENKSSSPIPNLGELQINSLPLLQGKTEEIIATGDPGLQITGSLNGYSLNFFQNSDGIYYALQGIHAMSSPGLAPFEISIAKDGVKLNDFSQMVYLQSRNFPEDPPLAVDPQTIDPAITQPEEDLLKQITSVVTPLKQWDGVFTTPVDEPCIKSWYGNRRSYNGGPYSSFHTGNDYGVCAPNFNIYAAAAGTVVFAGPLTVRGNATIIDHGQGIFTGYWHQKEISVTVGEHIEPGQLIGQIGATGRVNGPHLHFEIWVNGVQVDPSEWLEKAFP